MRYFPSTTAGIGTAVLAALVLGSCGDESNGGGGGGEEEVLQERLESGLDYTPAFTDAIDRLITTINGSPQPGVNIAPTGDGYSGTVAVDLDGNGSFDTSVSGTLTFNDPGAGLAGGAILGISAVEGLTTVVGQAAIGVTGPASAYIANGEFYGARTGTNPPLDLNVSNANMSLDVSTGNLVVSGGTEFDYNGLVGTMAFVPAADGFEIQVAGDDFDPFTVGP